MKKFNLCGSTQDEFERIAVEKGWVKVAATDSKSGLSKRADALSDATEEAVAKARRDAPSAPAKPAAPAPAPAPVKPVTPAPAGEFFWPKTDLKSQPIPMQIDKDNYPYSEIYAPTQSMPLKPGAPNTPAVPTASAPANPATPAVKKQSDPLVIKVQQKLQANKYNVGPHGADGQWGHDTQKAWDTLVQKAKAQGINTTSVVGKRPSRQELQYFYANGVPGTPNEGLRPNPYADDGAAGEKNEAAMLKTLDTGDALMSLNANIINELVSLANDLDAMGETKVAIAVDNQLNFYKSAMDKLYDVTGETGEKFINDAHKDHVTVAPSKEEGGKVENINEQQIKDLQVATKDPTGKYAKIIMQLVATANQLEAEGKLTEAEKVDRAIFELKAKLLPFGGKKLVSATNFYSIKKNADSVLISKLEKINATVEYYKGKIDTTFGTPQGIALARQFDSFIGSLFNCINSDKPMSSKDIYISLKPHYDQIMTNAEGGTYSFMGPTLGTGTFYEQALGAEDARDFYDFVTEQLTPFMTLLHEKAKSEKPIVKQPTPTEENPILASSKKKLQATVDKLINVISQKHEAITKLISPNVASLFLQYLKGEKERIQSYTEPSQFDNRNAAFWEIVKILKSKNIISDKEVAKPIAKQPVQSTQPVATKEPIYDTLFGRKDSFLKYDRILKGKYAQTDPDADRLEKAIMALVQSDKNKKPGGKPSGKPGISGMGRDRYNKNLGDVKDIQLKLFPKSVNLQDGKYGPRTHGALVSVTGMTLPDYMKVTPEQLAAARAALEKLPADKQAAKDPANTPSAPGTPAAPAAPGAAPAVAPTPGAAGTAEQGGMTPAQFSEMLLKAANILNELNAEDFYSKQAVRDASRREYNADGLESRWLTEVKNKFYPAWRFIEQNKNRPELKNENYGYDLLARARTLNGVISQRLNDFNVKEYSASKYTEEQKTPEAAKPAVAAPEQIAEQKKAGVLSRLNQIKTKLDSGQIPLVLDGPENKDMDNAMKLYPGDQDILKVIGEIQKIDEIKKKIPQPLKATSTPPPQGTTRPTNLGTKR